jgi:hypothetical protein
MFSIELYNAKLFYPGDNFSHWSIVRQCFLKIPVYTLQPFNEHKKYADNGYLFTILRILSLTKYYRY